MTTVQTKMYAARLHAIGDFRVDRVEVPVPEKGELLVKIGACGVCGSDIPRIFQLGTSWGTYPLTIGHEFSGTIVAVGPEETPELIGKRGAVFPLIPCRTCPSCQIGNYAMCEHYDYMGSRRDGGFAEYCLVPSRWHFVESQSPSTPLKALAMAEPASVAQHAVRRSRLTAGQHLLIFGAGPIGMLAARWGKIFGAQTVTLVDIIQSKIDFARSIGLDAVNSASEDVTEALLKRTGGALADVVLECTGSASALNNAIHSVKTHGTITLVGNPCGNTTIGQKEHSTLLRKEITIHSVWNSCFAPNPVNEWQYTVAMMDSGQLQVEDLITHTSNLEGLPELVTHIKNHDLPVCKAMYDSSRGLD